MTKFFKMDNQSQIQHIRPDKLSTALSVFRLSSQPEISRLKSSIDVLGMLHPIVVGNSRDEYQIIDGFKRYYACIELGMATIRCLVYSVSDTQAKALVIHCNKETGHIVDYEEAGIIYSLKVDEGLSGQEIALLLGKSTSWVSRRLSLIQKLDNEVKDQIKLGLISPSHAREIIKLPRGNQAKLSESIIKNSLTSRQSGIITEAYHQAKTKSEQDHILSHPLKVISDLTSTHDTQYDHRLSQYANKLLKTLTILHRQQCILKSQLLFKEAQIESLTSNDRQVLIPRLSKVAHNSEETKVLIKNILQQ